MKYREPVRLFVTASPVEHREPPGASRPPRTFISDLRPGRIATLEVTVKSLEPVRVVEQRLGGTKRMRYATITDGTGEFSWVLWGEEVELVKEGENVRIVNGWVKEWGRRRRLPSAVRHPVSLHEPA